MYTPLLPCSVRASCRLCLQPATAADAVSLSEVVALEDQLDDGAPLFLSRPWTRRTATCSNPDCQSWLTWVSSGPSRSSVRSPSACERVHGACSAQGSSAPPTPARTRRLASPSRVWGLEREPVYDGSPLFERRCWHGEQKPEHLSVALVRNRIMVIRTFYFSAFTLYKCFLDTKVFFFEKQTTSTLLFFL